jgi:hypothetical protein
MPFEHAYIIPFDVVGVAPLTSAPRVAPSFQNGIDAIHQTARG